MTKKKGNTKAILCKDLKTAVTIFLQQKIRETNQASQKYDKLY